MKLFAIGFIVGVVASCGSMAFWCLNQPSMVELQVEALQHNSLDAKIKITERYLNGRNVDGDSEKAAAWLLLITPKEALSIPDYLYDIWTLAYLKSGKPFNNGASE